MSEPDADTGEINEYVAAHLLFRSLPQSFRDRLQEIADEILSVAEEEQIEPEKLLSGISILSAAVVLSNCDVADSETIDARLELSSTAAHAHVAIMRLDRGFRLPKKN